MPKPERRPGVGLDFNVLLERHLTRAREVLVADVEAAGTRVTATASGERPEPPAEGEAKRARPKTTRPPDNRRPR